MITNELYRDDRKVYVKILAGKAGKSNNVKCISGVSLLAMYRGILAEQFVAQEMLTKDGSELY